MDEVLPRASWKEKFIGGWQKREILKFLNLAQPQVIHTSNPATMNRFKREGITAEFLYLFGNIPFHSSGNHSNEILDVAFFGTTYDQFPYELLGTHLKDISNTYAKEVNLHIIGRQRESAGLSETKGDGLTLIISRPRLPVNFDQMKFLTSFKFVRWEFPLPRIAFWERAGQLPQCLNTVFPSWPMMTGIPPLKTSLLKTFPQASFPTKR